MANLNDNLEQASNLPNLGSGAPAPPNPPINPPISSPTNSPKEPLSSLPPVNPPTSPAAQPPPPKAGQATEDIFALPSESEISAEKEKLSSGKISDEKDHQPIPEAPAPIQPTTATVPDEEAVKVTINSEKLPPPGPSSNLQQPSLASPQTQPSLKPSPLPQPPLPSSPPPSPENIVPIKPQSILKHQPAPKDILPPKKKRSCLKIFSVFLLILLLLIGAPIGLVAFGISIPYLSSYIEPYTLKYLNLGTTKDFSKVKSLSQAKVEASSGYDILASIKIGSAKSSTTKDLSSPPAPPAVDSGEETTIQSSTDSSTTDSQASAVWENLNIDIVAGTNNKAQSAGQLNISPQEMQTIFDSSYNFAVSGDALYLNPIGMTSTFDKNWLKIDGISKSVVFGKFIDLLDASNALKMITAGKWQKQEDTNILDSEGKAQATIAASSSYEVTLETDNKKISITKASLNTDKDYRPIKLSITGTLTINSSSVPIEINYYYYNFDSNPKVEIPAESEVQTVELNKFLTSQGFYGTSNDSTGTDTEEEKNARDETRQADIQKIADAAESYKSQNGSYPITSRVEKTNEEGALKQALVPDFIQSLPKDPLDSKYWYGYNSDGFSLQITAVIEGSKITSQQGQSVRYQEIKK